MFDNLSDKLQSIFSGLRGKGRLTEEDIDTAMREIRMALLEADVNFKVVKEFTKRTKERCLTAEVLDSLTPAQNVVKIVLDELTALMGEESKPLQLSSRIPNVIMLVGLQGSGKTTAAAKLAYLLKQQNHSPLLCACDVYRPAAADQLQTLGEEIGVRVYRGEGKDPVKIAKEGVRDAIDSLRDVVIVDTAGRLHVDEEMMAEAEAIKAAVEPDQIYMVVDAMTGQDAVNVAKAFNEKLAVTGVIVTKLDGDTRGGAALSVREVTGRPIKFCGTGEKLQDIEPFYPDRMASRILGMGDMLTLIEKAQNAFDEKKAQELATKLKTNDFTLEDFMEQMEQVKSMGSMEDILAMMPGANAAKLGNMEIDEKQTERMLAIVKSMTPEERRRPELLNASRRRRIAAGSGNSIQEVNRLLNQFEATRKMMRQFAGGKLGKMKKGRRGFNPFGF